MDRLNTIMIRTLLAPAPGRGISGLVLTVAAAIAACEVRTMGMGLHRSDGRNAGIADPVLLRIGHMIEAFLPVL